MGTTISLGFAAFVLSTAFGASAVSAQSGGDISSDVRGENVGSAGAGRAAVSVDVLRHPITGKVWQLLLRAMQKMESGDHETAIKQLRETLTKYPDSAAYVQNLLGVEYVKTDRFKDAVASFEQAVSLLPHDAMTHYNFGLALVCAGDYDRAAQEIQRALDLDPRNTKMQVRLNALLERKRSGN
jgi:tetratricopeptide (TPR) repeat protein